jgi:hypothetical protein
MNKVKVFNCFEDLKKDGIGEKIDPETRQTNQEEYIDFILKLRNSIPMKGKFEIILMNPEVESKIGLYGNKLYYSEFGSKTDDWKNQHLYIISDTNAKDGSWMIRDFDNAIIKDNINSDNRKGEKFFDILATTDSRLGLPSIPSWFIEQYVTYYNIDKDILDVEIETKLALPADLPKDTGGKTIAFDFIVRPKVDENNEIIIIQ